MSQLGFVYAQSLFGYTILSMARALDQLCHGDVFMVGLLRAFLRLLLWLGFHPSYLFAMVVCAVLNIVIERVAYKPLRNAPRSLPSTPQIGVSFFLETYRLKPCSARFHHYKAPL
jgi:branched-chain amino acid transport system permease protein